MTRGIYLADNGFDWAFNALKSGMKKGLVDIPSYSRFGFHIDPFSDELPFQFPQAMFKFPSLLNAFELVGKHLSDQKNMLVIAPEQSGKTFFLKFLSNLLKKPESRLNTLYIDSVREWRYSDLKNENESTLKKFHQWLAPIVDLEAPDVLLVDNISSLLPNDIIFSIFHELEVFDPQPIIIATLSFSEFQYITSSPYLNSSSFLSAFSSHHCQFLPILSKNQMYDFFLSRLQITDAREDLFSSAALDKLIYLSSGLPGLACKLASRCLDTAVEKDQLNEITLEHVLLTLSKPIFLGLETCASLVHGIYQIKQKNNIDTPDANFARTTINTPRFAILQEALKFAGQSRLLLNSKKRSEFALLHGGVSNSFLQNSPLGISKSTISHHLGTLSDQQNFLRIFERGRKKFYYLPENNVGPLEAASLLWSQSVEQEVRV
ncbi:MAG: hypothetical protein ACFFDT_11540 [Candidatus Hodarchaeota archaeon]